MRENILRRRIECGLKVGAGMSIVRLTDPQWRRHLVLRDGEGIVFRWLKPDDEVLLRALLGHVSKEDLRLRFFDSIKEFSHQFIAGLIELDERRAMAFVAIDESGSEMLGVVWVYCDSIHATGEYAILLRSDLKGRGLGWDLMQLIIEYANAEGLSRLSGQVLQENSVMLKMCRELGFEIKTDAEDRGLFDVTLQLLRPLI
jgi:RimJ/RimL family protein N-acetyltransferase